MDGWSVGRQVGLLGRNYCIKESHFKGVFAHWEHVEVIWGISRRQICLCIFFIKVACSSSSACVLNLKYIFMYGIV